MTTQTPVDIEREVERHMALPYRIELVESVDGGYFVRIPELPGCMSQGDNVEEAMEMIRDAQRGWLEVTLENGQPIPLPVARAGYSGKFTLRVPKRVHRALAEAAEAEGVSVNLFAASVLAMAVGEKASGGVDRGAVVIASTGNRARRPITEDTVTAVVYEQGVDGEAVYDERGVSRAPLP